MPAPPNFVFTIFAFVAFFLSLIKFLSRFHAWNVGIHLFLAWIGLQCLFLGINSIIWNHNTVNWAPVWCDITARVEFGVSIAIPAIILCINRRLYLLASTTLIDSQADKNREMTIDLVIGLGLPIILMALEFLIQASRFIIVEDYGCSFSLLDTWVALIIIYIPPVLLELISGVYGCLSIRAFYKRSKETPISNLQLNHSSNRYIVRLMCFSACDLLFGIPTTVFYLYLSITAGLVPFPGLTQEHSHFSSISQVPAVVWRASTLSELNFELNRWIMVWGAFLFFAIFGFSEESRSSYGAVLQSVVQFFSKITGIKARLNNENENAEGIAFYDSRSSGNQLSSS